MTVEEHDKVDVMATGPDRVRLIVSDHLDWDDELPHLLVLQHKLHQYIAFIESGEFAERFPALQDREVTIEVRFLHPPPEDVPVRFLDRVPPFVRASGAAFTWSAVEPSPGAPEADARDAGGPTHG